MKDVTPLQSAASGETIPRPFASSFKRSLGGPKISIRMSDRRSNISGSISSVEVPSDIEDKRKDIGDYRIAHSLLKSIILPTDVQAFEEVGGAFRIQDSYDSLLWAAGEIRSLKERVKLLEFELTKAEARVLGEREVGKARAEVVRVEVVQAFRASKEFRNIKMDFASLSYLQRGINPKKKVWRIFSDLNLDLLESDEEEAEGAKDRKIQMEDIFSPVRDNVVEDAALVPPSAVIDLPDQAMVDESGAPDRA
ncbi:hypothetical protein COCNU_03G014600 [Cocos nucifera]|uniref:Uncharacterized protein n=1 Tax=Cocos nucifera TaxID=13894 RepID=A0A8K0I4F5_COCNU|nr:hypothetical protein COCNU_03G014600 [Cocos nucifera]